MATWLLHPGDHLISRMGTVRPRVERGEVTKVTDEAVHVRWGQDAYALRYLPGQLQGIVIDTSDVSTVVRWLTQKEN